MGSLLIQDFSGGLNLRDAPNRVAPTETPDAVNFALTERGGIKRRNGCANVVALPGVSGKTADIFYSSALDLWLCCRETTGAPNTYRLHSRPGDLSGSWTDRGKIAFAVTARACFADWPGTTRYCLIGTDVVDATDGGVYTFDGTTLTKRDANAVVAIAVWQNKAWTCQHVTNTSSDANANMTRLGFSNVGDPTVWGSSVDLREKDASALQALSVVGGGLIAFKKRSTYRVTDPSSGAYTMIDPALGCVNPRAVASMDGRAYALGPDGLYACDGIGRLVSIGDKLRPLYRNIDPIQTVVGAQEDTILVYTTFASTGTEIAQFYPRLGNAAVYHTMASTSQNQFTSFARCDRAAAPGAATYAAMSDADAIFSMFTESTTGLGKDDATGYTCYWLTPWQLLNSGQLTRLQFARLQGLAGNGVTVSCDVYKDWILSSPLNFDVSASLQGSGQQAAAAMRSLGHSEAFAFKFSSNNATGSQTSLSIRALQLVDTPLAWPNPGYARQPIAATPVGSNPPPLPNN